MFELVIFTASAKEYADAILNLVDPYQEYFAHRLYRQNCVNLQGFFLKNLNVGLLGIRDAGPQPKFNR